MSLDKEKPGTVKEECIEDHEAETAAHEAFQEMKSESAKQSEREYQRMALDLRWEVLEYVDAHPEKSVVEIARLFGIKEGSIRAWKAHRTMGTYRENMAGKEKTTHRARQAPLFKSEATPKNNTRNFIERKRYSNFIHFFDKTPPGVVCPHFYILAHANGCPYFCDYCYLRLTLRHYPEPTVFSNTARMFQEIRDWLLSNERPSMLNAGELSDALAWDHETGLSANLISLFSGQSRHKLLLLTKSTNVEGILGLEPTPQAVISFSINAAKVARAYERGAPPPEKRLESAARLAEAGWEVRLRLDPLIPIEGWRDEYASMIDKINAVGPGAVTLGSLRFFRALLSHAPRGTDVFEHGVNHQDPDNRLRVPLEKRLEMYRFCLERIEAPRLGLCKETEPVHRELGLPGMGQSCNCTVE